MNNFQIFVIGVGLLDMGIEIVKCGFVARVV